MEPIDGISAELTEADRIKTGTSRIPFTDKLANYRIDSGILGKGLVQ